MVKPLPEFGGWLRFFQVVNLLSIVLAFLSIVLTIIVIIYDLNFKILIELSIYVIDLLITIYFTIKILAIIKAQDSTVPEKIIHYLKLIMIFSILFLIIEIPVILWANDGQWTKDDSRSVSGSLQTVIFFLIWRSYFRKSRRVGLYYRNNSPD